MRNARWLGRAAIGATLLVLAAGGVGAGASLDIDKETLNRILSAVAVTRVEVPVTAQRSLQFELRDLAVTGLEPVNGEQGIGFIRTAVRVVAPEIGLDVPLRPRISLNVVTHDGVSLIELRFEEVAVSVPLVGRINVAGMLPPMRYPADNAWLLAGTTRDVEVVSRLRRVEMDQRAIRFEFDVDVPGSP